MGKIVQIGQKQKKQKRREARLGAVLRAARMGKWLHAEVSLMELAAFVCWRDEQAALLRRCFCT